MVELVPEQCLTGKRSGTEAAPDAWGIMDGQTSLTPASRWLGYAGLLPQISALALALSGGEWAYVALAGGFAYAAAIFSFLGGIWWGQAIASGKGGAATYLVSVLPSLIAVALFIPWSLG
ncbi:MAG: DUF3429 domain-containing protein, partial [Pseudomonadota bacterium]